MSLRGEKVPPRRRPRFMYLIEFSIFPLVWGQQGLQSRGMNP